MAVTIQRSNRVTCAARICLEGISLRTLATIIPGIAPVDNLSEFLETVPHREHPGITSLKTVHLPSQLADAAQAVLEKHPVSQLAERTLQISTYLWSRKRPVEDETLRTKAAELEQKFLEKMAPLSAVHESLDPLQVEEQKENLRRQVLAKLRKTTYHWQPLNYDKELSLVYMAARMNGVYAAVSRAFHEIKKRVPEFQPYSLLDFGSGTGSVTWAAHQAWGESLKEYMCIDSSSVMNKLADLLLRGGSESSPSHINAVYFRQFLPVSPKVKFDVVSSAFSLNDLPSQAERISTVQTLWRKTGSYLGAKVSRESRSGIVFAPCPHDLPCPKFAQKTILPCNFTQAYHPLPYTSKQDLKLEKFSYVILQKGEYKGIERSWPRIIEPVLRRPRHVHCHLCCSDGTLQHAVITAKKHTKDLYRCARSSNWGDRLPVSNLETEKESENVSESDNLPST
ncbi:methyltransferase-like protein 17, mitochondrial isoform X2 [Protopterus annectens]|uniref:methyltransferase-like protein 17, mitochondrial isoform X2 n=1 Tax=Protopterus annectens TaxID=7888 RepID=UPI001CF9F96B|nr:methyltransferase-like protein 17, mitochondrial isoform X2 [Protopterus annectens]